MSGVIDGQAVDAVITNAAFLYKNANDISTGVYTLSAPTSGNQVNDIQNTINVLINGVGGNQSTPATAYSSIPNNTVAQGDTLNVGVSKLARKFYGLAASGGHSHSGVDGDGAAVAAVASLAPSGGIGATGNVTLSGGPYISIAFDSPHDINIGFGSFGLPDALAYNNTATAGVNFNGGAISGLSYIDWVATAGIPPGTPASGHVYLAASANHFYQKNASSAVTRVDTSLAASGSSALYGDVLLVQGSGVTLSQAGQNITISAVASSGSASINVLTKTANYTILTADFSSSNQLLVICNPTSFMTLTLPAASNTGYDVRVKNIGSAEVDIVPAGSDTIDGDTKLQLLAGGTPRSGNELIADGGSLWNVF